MKKILIVIVAVMMIAGSVWAEKLPREKPVAPFEDITVTGAITTGSIIGTETIGVDINAPSQTTDAGGLEIDLTKNFSGAGTISGGASSLRANTWLNPTNASNQDYTDSGYAAQFRLFLDGAAGNTTTVPVGANNQVGGIVASIRGTGNERAWVFDIPVNVYNSKGMHNLGGGSATFTGGFNHYNVTDSTAGTMPVQVGLWIDNLTRGTANYGIVLDGSDGVGTPATMGSGIAFGANQEIGMYSDGNGLVLTNLPFNGDGLSLLTLNENGSYIEFAGNARTAGGSSLGTIAFSNTDGTHSKYHAAWISSYNEGGATDDDDGDLRFYTNADGDTNDDTAGGVAAPVERVRITNLGALKLIALDDATQPTCAAVGDVGSIYVDSDDSTSLTSSLCVCMVTGASTFSYIALISGTSGCD